MSRGLNNTTLSEIGPATKKRGDEDDDDELLRQHTETDEVDEPLEPESKLFSKDTSSFSIQFHDHNAD